MSFLPHPWKYRNIKDARECMYWRDTPSQVNIVYVGAYCEEGDVNWGREYIVNHDLHIMFRKWDKPKDFNPIIETALGRAPANFSSNNAQGNLQTTQQPLPYLWVEDYLREPLPENTEQSLPESSSDRQDHNLSQPQPSQSEYTYTFDTPEQTFTSKRPKDSAGWAPPDDAKGMFQNFRGKPREQ